MIKKSALKGRHTTHGIAGFGLRLCRAWFAPHWQALPLSLVGWATFLSLPTMPGFPSLLKFDENHQPKHSP